MGSQLEKATGMMISQHKTKNITVCVLEHQAKKIYNNQQQANKEQRPLFNSVPP